MIESEGRSVHAADPSTVTEGDRVRLKFLYPNGSIEVLDCTWVAASTLGAPENPNGGWIVVSVDDRVLWKPLSHLIQLEVLEANAEARNGKRTNGSDAADYHR